jgi:hypothetical protein
MNAMIVRIDNFKRIKGINIDYSLEISEAHSKEISEINLCV